MYAECFSTYWFCTSPKSGTQTWICLRFQSSLHLSTKILLHSDVLHRTTRSIVEIQHPCKKTPFPSKVGWIFGWVVGFPWLLIHKGLHRFRAWTPTNLAGTVTTLFQHLSKVPPSFNLFICFLSFLGIFFKLGFYFQWDDCKLLVYSNNNWTTTSTTSKICKFLSKHKTGPMKNQNAPAAAKVQFPFGSKVCQRVKDCVR